MSNLESTPIYVNAQNKPTREAKFNFESYNAGDRLGRAFAVLGICLLVAGVTLFIPIAHFVLVPGALIVGIYMFVSRYRMTQSAKSVEVKCPLCEVDVTIKLDPEQQPPFYCYCSNCDGNLHVTGTVG